MGSCVGTQQQVSNQEFFLPASLQFETTRREMLMDILKHPQLSILFHKYLKSTFCHETLAFFIDAEEYRHIPDAEARYARANQIIAKYFSADSPMELSISGDDLAAIKANVAPNCPVDLFARPQQFTQLTLIDDCLPNFLTWELYSNFVADPSTRRVFLIGIRKTESVAQIIKYSENLIEPL
eukprot:TRINITY_DN15585_c0_g1_i1.p1 TRINITY_DN15585_c0_g1~~TRINITY_DN15585_c0_g1_i1.p1  ORF type:complete len:199 (+),score=31.66 TRINITY_DN15585_c0_g1_i1:52-597(+)